MSSLYKKIELLSNIAIIIVALLLGVVLVKRYILNSPGSADVKPVSAGTRLDMPDMDWGKSRRTLLLALAQGCHFCSESAPFYQRLAKEAAGRDDIRLIAVFPQPTDEGHKYLDDLGVPIKDVRKADFASIQVRGTPTLILVDSSGVVTDAWVGKLPSDKETEVISKFQCDTCGS